jgi:hypothetical protein
MICSDFDFASEILRPVIVICFQHWSKILVTTYLKMMARWKQGWHDNWWHRTNWHQQGIETLVSRYDKCLDCGGDYVEMQWDNNINAREVILNVEIKESKTFGPKPNFILTYYKRQSTSEANSCFFGHPSSDVESATSLCVVQNHPHTIHHYASFLRILYAANLNPVLLGPCHGSSN